MLIINVLSNNQLTICWSISFMIGYAPARDDSPCRTHRWILGRRWWCPRDNWIGRRRCPGSRRLAGSGRTDRAPGSCGCSGPRWCTARSGLRPPRRGNRTRPRRCHTFRTPSWSSHYRQIPEDRGPSDRLHRGLILKSIRDQSEPRQGILFRTLFIVIDTMRP